MRAGELMSKDIVTIDEEEKISEAISLFTKAESIIVMKGGEYKGILTEKDIMRAKIPLDAKVKSFVKHAPKIDVNMPIQEVARLMLENDVYHLPVFENEKLVGIIRDEDLLKKISEEIGEEPIEKYMTRNPKTVSPDDNIGKVIKIFKEENVSRLPVIKDEKLVGIITIHDLMEKVLHPEEKPEYGEFIAEKKRYLKIPVKGIMVEEPIVMPPNAKVKEVIKEMLKNKFGGMLIAKEKKLMGIVTKKDLLEPIASYGREEKIYIQFSGELDKIEGFDKEEGMLYLKEFVRKYEEFLENGYLCAYLKQHKEKKHGLSLIYCKLRLSSPKGFFIASSEGWGFRQALKNTINAMEKQIEKEKE